MKNVVNCVLVSRLVKEKFNSIVLAIETITYMKSRGIPVVLKIAGAGDCLDELEKVANQTNRMFNEAIINFLGHVPDVEELLFDAHLVFGKGRGVLEGIMTNRIGIVVGEDSRMALCKATTIENLYTYNYSGRNITETITKNQICSL